MTDITIDSLEPIKTNDVFAEIHDELEQSRHLAAIDLALRSLDRGADDKTQRRVLRLLCRGSLLHVGATVSDTDRAIDAVFHPELAYPTKRFVAICLLRALEANPDLFMDVALRNRTFLLFDAVLPDLYKECRIDPRRQTHEKEAALRSYVHDTEHELEEVFRPLERMQNAGWESISHSRADVLRLLKKYGSVVTPFLNKDLLGPAIEDLFGRVREYIESDESSAIHSYERAKSGLESYGQEAHDYQTKYSGMLCEKLSSVLLTICERKFEQSGAGKPARLVAKPFDKKYPFGSPTHPVHIGFNIENVGSGYARDVSCSISTDSSAVVKRPELFLGDLGVDKIAVEFPVELSKSVSSILVDLTWTWSNFDGSCGSETGIFELFGQQGNVNWDQLATEEPYKLEPITSEQELVGRTEILSQLAAKARGAKVGSACIWGQKRVGKTSIAKTLRTRLSSEPNSGTLVLFLEAGEYVHPDANRTIEQLGAKICRQIASSDPRFQGVSKPSFNGALSPLSDYVDDVLAISPALRIIVILDEFDSVPVELYRRGPTGETFFSTIRSLSQKGQTGFILVGGERMRYVFDCQGQALNKFQMIRVDYLDRSLDRLSGLDHTPDGGLVTIQRCSPCKDLFGVCWKSLLHGSPLSKSLHINGLAP
jgi:AAA domain